VDLRNNILESFQNLNLQLKMAGRNLVRESYTSNTNTDHFAGNLQEQGIDSMQSNAQAMERLTGEVSHAQQGEQSLYRSENPPLFQSTNSRSESSDSSLSPPVSLREVTSSRVRISHIPLNRTTSSSSATSLELSPASPDESRFPRSLMRSPSLMKTAMMRSGSYMKRAYNNKQEQMESKKKLPPCKSHNTVACAEHLHWYVGSDKDIMHESGTGVAVPVLAQDEARFEMSSDAMIQPGGEEQLPRSFAYEEPKRHWFYYCKSCRLIYLKGSAGNAVSTHPGHLCAATSGTFKYGARAVAVHVDGTYDHETGLARWSVYFGPDSPENKVRSSRSLGLDGGKAAEMRALRDALDAVSTSVVASRRDCLSGGKVKSNCGAFVDAACRFTLVVFSPLKAAMTLCADECGRVLEFSDAASGFFYPDEQQRWLSDRLGNSAWLEEKKGAERAIEHLAMEGVQVKFAFTPVQDYSEKWKLFTSAV
jgi:hypothetical protein